MLGVAVGASVGVTGSSVLDSISKSIFFINIPS